MVVYVSKQKATKLGVLEALKEGKTINEIAEKFNVKPNAVYSHVRRLKLQGLWEKEKAEIIELKSNLAQQTNNLDYDKLINAWLDKLSHTLDLEEENKYLKDENYKLKNKLAATENELVVATDELKGRREATERVKQIQKRLIIENQRLTEEATQ